MFLHLKLDLDIESVDWIGEQSPEDPVKPDSITDYDLPKELQEKLADIRTDLDSFSDVEGFALMTSGYRMAKHEFGKSIDGVAKTPNEVCWQFQSIAPAIDPEADAYADVLKILKVANLAAAKIWVLSKTLLSARRCLCSVCSRPARPAGPSIRGLSPADGWNGRFCAHGNRGGNPFWVRLYSRFCGGGKLSFE